MSESVLPSVDVIVVLYNSARFLPALVDGLLTVDYPKQKLRVHVVDNNPGDGSLDEWHELTDAKKDSLPQLIVHEPKTNTGFSGGNNLAMRQAIDEGIDYVFLHNHDASLEPNAIREAVLVAQSDAEIGSVQPLMVLQDHPDEVNSAGNAIHYIGFGYCNGYHQKRSDISDRVVDIAYASGGAVLFPTRVLKDVGLLDETLWLYHEDLDLGWRILLAGYRNVLAPRSVVRHRYEFSRSVQKMYWMERNRDLVILKNYRLATIILLSPQIVLADLGLLAFAMKGGWGSDKLRALTWFLKSSTWSYLARGRKEIARIRRVSDREVLKKFTAVIAFQEFESPLVTRVMNPLWNMSFSILKFLVIW